MSTVSSEAVQKTGCFGALEILDQVQVREGRYYARLDELEITSAFQPIFSLAHKKPIGYEGLIRAFDKHQLPISPLEVFSRLEAESDIMEFDRICRALHVRNAQVQGLNEGWLFLNVHSRVVAQGNEFGPFFEQLLDITGLPPHRVVIETLEDAIPDENRLAEAVRFFKKLGCLVAIDDFGAGHSNFNRIWHLRPDIVKLDRSIVQQVDTNPDVADVLPGLVSLLHEAGCLTVMEGVETEGQALMAMQADVDFVQGFYFAKPMLDLLPEQLRPVVLNELCSRFTIQAKQDLANYQQEMSSVLEDFEHCVRGLQAGGDMQAACMRFLKRPNVICCYLLDQNGMQIGSTLDGLAAGMQQDPRYSHLADASGATWYRRHYYRRAIYDPGRVNVSRPYLSIRDAHRCVTLSISFNLDGQMRVLCADLKHK